MMIVFDLYIIRQLLKSLGILFVSETHISFEVLIFQLI